MMRELAKTRRVWKMAKPLNSIFRQLNPKLAPMHYAIPSLHSLAQQLFDLGYIGVA